MIQPYREIAIIYGSSGRSFAGRIYDELQRLHTEEHYPIRPRILNEELLSSRDIMDRVKEMISSASACVIILTFDDVDHTRLRQNVILELGMAMMVIGREKCYFLSDHNPLPEDFLSDMKGLVNPNPYDLKDPDTVAVKLGKKLVEDQNLTSTNGLLGDDRYEYNYLKILDDIPRSVFEKKYDQQLKKILDCWETTIHRMDLVSERILYILERINFFSNFTIDARFFLFLQNLEREIRQPLEADLQMYERSYLQPVCNLTCSILHYLRTKYDRTQPDLRGHLEDIEDELQDFVDSMNIHHYNWYIQAEAYDYLALVSMKLLSTRAESPASINRYSLVIGNLVRALEITHQYDNCSGDLWNGYLYYNLARAHEHLYRCNQDPGERRLIRKYIGKAVRSRSMWLEQTEIKGAFESALSYEYFLASKYEQELHYRYAADRSLAIPEILTALSGLRAELRRYCRDTRFGRLYEIRDELDALEKKIEE